jgi:hypothetical protein
MYSKWIKDRNIRTKTVVIGGKLHDLGFGNDFSAETPKTQAKRRKYKLDYFKYYFKHYFGASKGIVNRVKWQPKEWGKILGSHVSDSGLVIRTYKGHVKHTKITNHKNTGQKTWNRPFSKEDVQKTNRYMR